MSEIVTISGEVEALPVKGITVMALRALDFVVPGQWVNTTDFDEMIRRTTGAEGPDVAEIRRRAELIYGAPDARYRKALKVYRAVDIMDKGVAVAAMANKIGQSVSFLKVLNKLTPKADTTQSVDAGLKFVAEVVAFFMIHGMPRDGVRAFGASLKDYAKADLMRLSAWVVFDGLIPLGPDFVEKIGEGIGKLSAGKLGNNKLFSAISGSLPGKSVDDKRGFITAALANSSAWINDFVDSRGLTQEMVASKLKAVIGVSDNGLDYLAAALDAGTNYYAHTGTQTVARSVIAHAHRDLQAERGHLLAAAPSSAQATTVLQLGRDDTPGVNDVVVDAPMVSSEHCRVTFGSDGWIVEDLDSSNGTAINSPEQTLARGEITVEDILYLGSYPYPVSHLARRAGVEVPAELMVTAPGQQPGHVSAMEEARDRAMMTAVCLSALSDGTLADAEKRQLVQIVKELPAYKHLGADRVVKLLKETLERLEHRGFGQGVKEVVTTLTAVDDKRSAFALAAMLRHADSEVTHQENVFLQQFGRTLGLSDQVAYEIVQQVEQGIANPSS